MSNRLEKFLACKHRNVQQYTDICLDCNESLYKTAAEMEGEEQKSKEDSDSES